MLLSKKARGFWLPVPEKPVEGTNTLVAAANGATHTIYTVQIPGWHYVEVCGGKGNGGVRGTPGGVGGKIKKLVYLYAGTKILLWGSTSGTTGYPEPTNALGGHGASGYLGDESGGYGGGAATSAGGGFCSSYGSCANGAAGAGMLAGLETMPLYSKENEASGFTTDFPLTVGEYSVQYVYCALLCGGGGGGVGDEGDHRSGGGGGGAWGNGGTSFWSTTANTEGPGGNWGAGGGSGRYGYGGAGAWAVLDFTTNAFEHGFGGGDNSSTGYARLYRVS